MKLNQIAGVVLAGVCVLGTADAFAEESVAVMKIDSMGAKADSAADALLSSIRNEVTSSTYRLEASGSDITYTEMQMVTGCDREGSIACYDAACETLGSKSIIFGNIQETGEAHVIWYVSGKGIFREAKAKLTDKVSVDKLAKEIVIGEMGEVIVTSNIPGADVFIDGKRVGMSAEFKENAQPIELVTGNYIIAVRKDGFTKEDAVTVTIEGGKTSYVHVDMSVQKNPEDIRNAIKIAGYASLGVGVASFIGMGVSGALMSSKNKKMNDYITVDKDCSNNRCEDLNELGKNLQTARNVLAGVGSLFTAAGVALIVTGFVYDFEGEDIDKAYSYKYVPKVDFSIAPEYKGMGLTWDF